MQTIRVHLTPHATRNACEVIDDLLTGEKVYKIRLTAKPIDGEANKALVEFLSEHFDLPKRQIVIIQGEKSRHKIVRLGE